jgi:hypothetical protein
MAYNLVAIYRSRADAERARERLIRDNILAGDIRVVTGTDVDVAQPSRPGIFDWLFARNVPEEDQTWYRSHLFGDRAAVSVRVEDEMWRDRVLNILEEFNPLEENELGATGTVAEPGIAEPAAAPSPLPEREVTRPAEPAAVTTVSEGEQVIPVVKEELTVGKRPVERRHRIRTYVVERPVEEQVNLRDERVVVERRPVSGPVDPNALQEREFEVIERHEEPVAEKRTRGVEEVVVHKERQDHVETVRDTVRETRVEVDGQTAERTAPEKPRP